jgi:hypothetical protein
MSIHTEVAVNELARLRHWIDLAVLQQLSAMISDLIGGFWFSPGSAIIVFDHPWRKQIPLVADQKQSTRQRHAQRP